MFTRKLHSVPEGSSYRTAVIRQRQLLCTKGAFSESNGIIALPVLMVRCEGVSRFTLKLCEISASTGRETSFVSLTLTRRLNPANSKRRTSLKTPFIKASCVHATNGRYIKMGVRPVIDGQVFNWLARINFSGVGSPTREIKYVMYMNCCMKSEIKYVMYMKCCMKCRIVDVLDTESG